MSDVDALRAQLRDRGYLTHGIERWFALDPWSSRTFWVELATVALKAAILIALFGALPPAAIMVFRNYPLHAVDTLGLFVSYAAVWLVAAFLAVVIVALILKLRPALPIDTPRALLAISFGVSTLLVAPVALWWYRFDTAPPLTELIVGSVLLAIFFLVATIVVSAALLSFSIYELKRVPAFHQKRRGAPMTVAAAMLIALLFVPAYADRGTVALEPMVVTSPTIARVALIAVDGLTHEILQSRPDLARALPHVSPIRAIPGDSTTERWASLGTGVPTEAHGVRAIEGVRFRGGSHVLQRISRGDFVLMHVAPSLGLARREPLPPTVRRRDYVWEIFAERGLTSVAVNWWATADAQEAGLHATAPDAIFGGARGDALRVDALATGRFLQELDARKPRFATVYLPALDVILNRQERDRATQLAASLRALDGVLNAITLVRARGYDVVVAGMPGEGQSGQAVVASSIPFAGRTAWDVAPTLLDTLGFPLSAEMPGGVSQPRIASYGAHASTAEPQPMNDEYYENLKSLGYIQ
ncbi:MAG TPA: alkaline phosphatase family protein [Thermoanaerobaculia bacterium]|nr:alkaline phosphatase family protein [Thermoanaerobaculia bacterium]